MTNGTADTAPPSVLLVGYEDRENLGLRYLLASVRKAGFEGEILRLGQDNDALVREIVQRQPRIVGLSLIFQYMAGDFARLVAALRNAGLCSHITMGGHFPSFEWHKVLECMPGLDSVVRFEGEATLVELIQRVSSGVAWQDIAGLAYREGGQIRSNPLRPAEEELDRLTTPARDGYDYLAEDPATAAMLGSRGCPWRCSFCSIRPFYAAQGGRPRRLRSPAAVLEEMVSLYQDYGVRVYLFQDDDFLAGGHAARAWATEIADRILGSNLAGKVAYKINSRSDGIEPTLLCHLRDSGLTHVYLGVEAGDANDLGDMDKHMNATTHLHAGNVLRALGLSFDFGYMLLQPYSTLERVRNNVEFLDEFVGDGWSIASFCRMLPYAGTKIRQRLASDGRLRGTEFQPDYAFLDRRLDVFYEWMLNTFHRRNFTANGLSHAFRAIQFEARLRLPSNSFTETEQRFVQHLCAVSNRVAIDTLRTAVDFLENSLPEALHAENPMLTMLSRHQYRQDERIERELVSLYSKVLERRRQRRVRRAVARPFEVV